MATECIITLRKDSCNNCGKDGYYVRRRKKEEKRKFSACNATKVTIKAAVFKVLLKEAKAQVGKVGGRRSRPTST